MRNHQTARKFVAIAFGINPWSCATDEKGQEVVQHMSQESNAAGRADAVGPGTGDCLSLHLKKEAIKYSQGMFSVHV